MTIADMPEDDVIEPARVKRVLVKPQKREKFSSGTAISVPTFLCLFCDYALVHRHRQSMAKRPHLFAVLLVRRKPR